MYSLDYLLANTRGFRKVLRWWNSKKLSTFINKEKDLFTSNPLDLRNFEKKIFSQNGEDGIIEEIFRRIGTTNRFFVEFGIENGNECNTRALIENQKWQGLWIDGSEENCKAAQKQFSPKGVFVQKAFVKKENIADLFAKNQVPKELDLLVIDIDGNDYWVWEALHGYSPRVVVIEYNASYLPSQDWIMPYKADHMFDGTIHYGASLKSMSSLAEQMGYVLVGCDKNGVNAFFLRKDLLKKELFLEKDLEYFYSSPKYNCFFFGHPRGKGPWIKKRSDS